MAVTNTNILAVVAALQTIVTQIQTGMAGMNNTLPSNDDMHSIANAVKGTIQTANNAGNW